MHFETNLFFVLLIIFFYKKNLFDNLVKNREKNSVKMSISIYKSSKYMHIHIHSNVRYIKPTPH